jgi:hypothetical protein
VIRLFVFLAALSAAGSAQAQNPQCQLTPAPPTSTALCASTAFVHHVANSGAPWVAAGGTSDAITATYVPTILPLADGQIAYFRATASNATTTPTFAPNGATAATITRDGGAALSVGDIPGALSEEILRYNLAHTRWELLNPAGGGSTFSGTTIIAAGGVTVAPTALYYTVIIAKTVAATTAVTLPASPSSWQIVVVKDGKCNAASNNITITPAAGNIDISSSLIMNQNCESVTLQYNGTQWFVQ